MPNRKLGDNPLSDLTIHGVNRFPEDIKRLLIQIDELGRGDESWPLGANWPYSPREFDWEKGNDLDEGRQLLRHYIAMLEEGRGDELMVDPLTRRPFIKTD